MSLEELAFRALPSYQRAQIRRDPALAIQKDITQQMVNKFIKSTLVSRNLTQRKVRNFIQNYKVFRLMAFTIIEIPKYEISPYVLHDELIGIDNERAFQPGNWDLFIRLYDFKLAEKYENDPWNPLAPEEWVEDDGSWHSWEERWTKQMWALYFTHNIVYHTYWYDIQQNNSGFPLFLTFGGGGRRREEPRFMKLVESFKSMEQSIKNATIYSFAIYDYIMKNHTKQDMIDEGI